LSAFLDRRACRAHVMAPLHETGSMDKFTTLTAVAAPLNMINVDTDMIIPKDYLKTIERTGLGKGLFAELKVGAIDSPTIKFCVGYVFH